MGFVEAPNLPSLNVSLVIADGRIPSEVKGDFAEQGIKVAYTSRHPRLYDAVAWHPDMFLIHLGHNDIVYAPGTGRALLDELESYGLNLVMGKTELTGKYPGDIAYNVAVVGGYYFHNLRYTDPVVGKHLIKRGYEPVHVKQGYTKCSTAVVTSKSIMTSDTGIAEAAGRKGLEVLLLEPCRDILLPGLDHGFIGGAVGMTAPGVLSVCGSANSLLAYPSIKQFLKSKKISIHCLSHKPVLDIGSILPLKT